MKISYDRNLEIASISLTPWSSLGLEDWLKNFTVVSYFDWDHPDTKSNLKVIALKNIVLDKLNVNGLINTKGFRDLVETDLNGYALFPHRPIIVPKALKKHQFLMNDLFLRQKYENKVEFRNIFSKLLSIPSYKVYSLNELRNKPFFKDISKNRKTVVLQQENNSGSKGTFIISSQAEYKRVLRHLSFLEGNDRILISKYIKARELSVQCVITKQGLFIGPLQRQILGMKDLVPNDLLGLEKFCGGVIDHTDNKSKEYMEAKQAAKIIASKMSKDGYKGIFGIDFLLDENAKLFVIEINARLTGFTPLLSAMYSQTDGIPFNLLHILALGDYKYKIVDKTVKQDNDGSLLLLHSKNKKAAILSNLPKSGTYTFKNDQLERVNRNIDLNKITTEQFILQDHVTKGAKVKTGKCLIGILFNEVVIDKNGQVLYNNTNKIIKAIEKQISY